MNDQSIGRLERVPLRTVWKHEAYDFTQWLQDNADVLNEALNISLVNIDREQAAGAFSIDLVAEDENGNKVIIENQLEKSNHDHLGKLITYLTTMQARTAIWIVSEPRPEHVAAITWLNDNNAARFYMVKVEAVRIGQSPPAPMLTVIVGPSDDQSDVVKANREFSERYDLRERWWKLLLALPAAKLHAHITPGIYSSIGASSGVRGLGFHYSVTQDQSSAELYIDRGKGNDAENKSAFDQLHAHKDAIETAFGGPLSWERLDNKRACRIRALIDGGYRSPEDEWEPILVKLADAMNRLDQALKPFLKTIRLSA